MGGTLGTCGMSLTIIIVNGLLLFGVSAAYTLGDAWVRSWFLILFCDFYQFFNLSAPSLLTMFLIALLQSSMVSNDGVDELKHKDTQAHCDALPQRGRAYHYHL